MVLAATGCQVDVDVTVTVEDDASGDVIVDVILDEAAAEKVTELDAMLETSDLTEAGWDVGPAESTAAGGLVVSASKPFGTAEELVSILGEVAGPEQLFRDVEVLRERPFGQVDLGFGGVLDPSGGLEQFGDADLGAALGGFPLGVDLDELEEELGVDPASTVSVNLETVMAGQQNPDPAVWTVQMDQAEPVRFATLSTVELTEPRRWVRWAMFAAVAFVAVVLIELIWVWSRRRRRG